MKEICELPLNSRDVDMKTELIRTLIPIGLWHVKEVLERDVKQLAGVRYQRVGVAGHDRWGQRGGDVGLKRVRILRSKKAEI